MINYITASSSSSISSSNKRLECKNSSNNNLAEKSPNNKANYAKPSVDLIKSYYMKRSLRKDINFQAIRFISISSKFKPLEEVLTKRMQNFADTEKGAKSIGKGLSSEAYTISDMPEIVFKKSLRSDTFTDEEKYMKEVPDTIKGSQEFIGRTYDDKTGKYYLLSTKVKGESPDPDTNPWTTKHLNDLFDKLFEMDKTGFYHGDLNNGNIKLEKNGNVNFLDYQWSNKIDKIRYYENKPLINTPNFIHVQNSQMLEESNLPSYLKNINNRKEEKDFLKTYLVAKSIYHQKRADFIRENHSKDWPYSSEVPNVNKALHLEEAQAELFKNPSDDIVNIEMSKIRFLNSFREGYKHADPNLKDQMNIIPAGSKYLKAFSDVNDFRSIVEMRKGRVPKQSTEASYLDAQMEYSDYWFNNLKKWSVDNFEAVVRQVEGTLEPGETPYNFNKVNIEDFGVSSHVDQSYFPHSDSTDSYRDVSFVKKIYNMNVKNIGIAPNSKPMRNIIEKQDILGETINKLKDVFIYKEQRRTHPENETSLVMANIDNSLLATLRARQLEEEAQKEINNNYLSSSEEKYAKKVIANSKNIKETCRETARSIFYGTHSDIFDDYEHVLNF